MRNERKQDSKSTPRTTSTLEWQWKHLTKLHVTGISLAENLYNSNWLLFSWFGWQFSWFVGLIALKRLLTLLFSSAMSLASLQFCRFSSNKWCTVYIWMRRDTMNLMVLHSFSFQQPQTLLNIEWCAIWALFIHCLMFLSLDFIRLCSSTFVYFAVIRLFCCVLGSQLLLRMLMLLMRFVFSTFKELWIVLLSKWKLSTTIFKIGLFIRLIPISMFITLSSMLLPCCLVLHILLLNFRYIAHKQQHNRVKFQQRSAFNSTQFESSPTVAQQLKKGICLYFISLNISMYCFAAPFLISPLLLNFFCKSLTLPVFIAAFVSASHTNI